MQVDGTDNISDVSSDADPTCVTNQEYSDMSAVATYNLRSLFPKIKSFKTDMLEREIDCAFLCEIWENAENESHQSEIENLLELYGLKYFSFT